MKRSWILMVSTVGFVSGLLFGTVALGKLSPRLRAAMWRVARPCISGTAPVVTGLRAEGMGIGFFEDRIRLTSHHRRPERNPMPTCSRLSMTANRTCRLGISASRRKRVGTCWPMCAPSPSEAMRPTSLSAGVAGEKKRGQSLC